MRSSDLPLSSKSDAFVTDKQEESPAPNPSRGTVGLSACWIRNIEQPVEILPRVVI